MDRCAIIRSVVGATDRHDAFQCMTGWLTKELGCARRPPESWVGCVAIARPGRAFGATVCWAWRNRPKRSAGLIPASRDSSDRPLRHSSLMVPGRQNMTLHGLTLEQLQDRRRLLGSLDTLRRELEATDQVDAIDRFTAGAFDVLTSSRLVERSISSKEDPKVRARYGTGQAVPVPVRRRSDRQRALAVGSAARRSRCPRGDALLRSLGQPLAKFRSGPGPRCETRSVPECLDHRI